MNEHLEERFGRRCGSKKDRTTHLTSSKDRITVTADHSIRNYCQAFGGDPDAPEWAQQPEIPTAKEIWQPAEEECEEVVELDENLVVGPHRSKESYLECHYRLVREDAGMSHAASRGNPGSQTLVVDNYYSCSATRCCTRNTVVARNK